MTFGVPAILPPAWYVMLEPDSPPPESYLQLGRHWAAATGGTFNAMPHVTVGYLQAHASRHEVARSLCNVAGAELTIRGRTLVSFRDDPHPIFGYTLSLAVEDDEDLRAWSERVVEALAPFGPAERGATPHIQVLRGMGIPPQEAIQLLSATDWTLTFTVTQLVASQFITDFHQFLRWPLESPP